MTLQIVFLDRSWPNALKTFGWFVAPLLSDPRPTLPRSKATSMRATFFYAIFQNVDGCKWTAVSRGTRCNFFNCCTTPVPVRNGIAVS
jgi:hypothetical protein